MNETHEDLNRQGVALRRRGKNEQAIDCYRRALKAQPDFAEAHYNLGLLWNDLDRVADAITCFQRVLQLRPDVALAHFSLGNALARSGEVRAAIASYRNAIDRMPAHAETHANLATMLHQAGEYAEAEVHFRTALELKPDDPSTLVNLGNTLKQRSKQPEACACYQKALNADPSLWQAHSNLANTQMEMGEFRTALEGYRRAAELHPDAAEPYLRQAHALSNLKHTAQAIPLYEKALALQPDLVEAHVSLGHLYKAQGDVDQARNAYQAASKAEPENRLHQLREAALCPLVFSSNEELSGFRQQFQSAVYSTGSRVWDVPLAKAPRAFCECPYNLQFLEGNLRPLREAYADIFQAYFQELNAKLSPHPNTVRRSARRRVGFVVTAGHEAAFLRLIAGVVRRLNTELFEVFVVCSKTGAGKLRRGLEENVPLVEYPERFDWAVETIRSAAFDLLYYWEIGTDPVNYFLPFLRLAPVQCTSWGIQVTSGIPQVDYYLSSEWVEPADADDHYRERLIRARTLLTYQGSEHSGGQPRRGQFGFSDDQHLYGCVQNLGKFHPDFDRILGDILRRDPSGWLVLSRDREGHAARVLQQRFSRTLADVASRIVFLPPKVHAEYLALIASCDVLLEPLHFGGVTTTYDALARNKPLVAMQSAYHRGRYASACYRKMGLEQWVAGSCNEYVDLAVRLGCDADYRWHCSEQLSTAKQAVFNDPDAVAEHERIFLELLADVS